MHTANANRQVYVDKVLEYNIYENESDSNIMDSQNLIKQLFQFCTIGS